VAPPRLFPEKVRERALALAAQSDRPKDAKGIALTPLKRAIDDAGLHYEHVDVAIDGDARTITITINGPSADEPVEKGAQWWPLAMARELDDAILHLRTNVREAGIWIVKTRGEIENVLRVDETLDKQKDNWFVRETIGFLRRTLQRLDVSSRSIYAVIDRGSCFAGTLFELALAADRSYMLAADDGPKIALSAMNFGPYETLTSITRLQARFGAGVMLSREDGEGFRTAEGALDAGLVTFAPDDLDWDDELRVAIEERASLNPDALTGMEASLRFAGEESMATKIFGRLSAWQNWIFMRPNATGEEGALKVYGSGTKPRFAWERV
jgi:benzoyl-CoA-dihydrodiol lyase